MSGTSAPTGDFLLPPTTALHRAAARRARRRRRRRCSLAALGALVDPAQFFRSYLVAYLFWLGIALGSLALLMIQHVTGGALGRGHPPLLESATRTLPLLALLFLPLALGARHLYEWARPERVAHDPLLQHKSALPERAVLPRARGVLLRRLDAAWRAS